MINHTPYCLDEIFAVHLMILKSQLPYFVRELIFLACIDPSCIKYSREDFSKGFSGLSS